MTSLKESPSTTEVWVKLKEKEKARKGEFVVIEDARKKDTLYLGRIVETTNESMVLKHPDSVIAIEKMNINPEEYVKGAISSPELFFSLAKVSLIYQLENNTVKSVDIAPTDGSKVYVADTQIISRCLGLASISEGLHIGELYSNPNVKVILNCDRICGGHVCIFGQTWSGKSYLAGVLVEEVVKKGIPVIVFDHVGEYSAMSESVEGGKGLKTKIFTPGKDLKIDPYDLLSYPEILNALGITEAQFNLLTDAMNEAKLNGKEGIDALDWLFERIKVKKKKGDSEDVSRLYVIGRRYGYSTATVDGLRWKLHRLIKLGIFGQRYDVRELVKKEQLTIIDLSKVNKDIATLFVADILYKLLEARKNNLVLPTVTVLEEAHNYVPSEETPSSVMIRDLIRGARHWGIGVWLISQRPAGIHRDAINIANTHILLRLKGTDLEYVKTFASLTKEEVAEIPNLPDGVALVTGPIIRGGQGLKVIVRERRTKHGGHSISFLKAVNEDSKT